MSEQEFELLSFENLYSSGVVTILDYQCRAGRGGPMREEYADSDHIVLMRRGTFCRHFGHCRSDNADINRTVFFSKDSTYRVSHPADCGDRGTVLVPSPEILTEVVLELAPELVHNGRMFPSATGPCSSQTFRRHRFIIDALQTKFPFDQLLIDEAALSLFRGVLQDVLGPGERLHGKRRKTSTRSTHAEQVEFAKVYLSENASMHVNLHNVASAVGLSPFHLSRIFKEHTGLTVHRYLSQMRLRMSVECLSANAQDKDLGRLALDLGYSSHSHFSDSFQREFQCAPSEFRSDNRNLHKLSKNLKA
jgi:AraC family transcriptional regulator